MIISAGRRKYGIVDASKHKTAGKTAVFAQSSARLLSENVEAEKPQRPNAEESDVGDTFPLLSIYQNNAVNLRFCRGY